MSRKSGHIPISRAVTKVTLARERKAEKWQEKFLQGLVGG
jgi:hypothetical protein